VKDYVNAGFHSITNHTYTAMCYCHSSTDYVYSTATALAVTSNDNGGMVTDIILTYTTYFDEAVHNTDLLKVAGAMASGIMIANERITDRWGGIFGKSSALVPTNAAFNPLIINSTNSTATNTSTTATTTRLLDTADNTIWNLTASAYPVHLFI